MKHTISFRMWEMKRGLIIKLYQEEEWPLKQVLKRIRSDTFNPRWGTQRALKETMPWPIDYFSTVRLSCGVAWKNGVSPSYPVVAVRTSLSWVTVKTWAMKVASSRLFTVGTTWHIQHLQATLLRRTISIHPKGVILCMKRKQQVELSLMILSILLPQPCQQTPHHGSIITFPLDTIHGMLLVALKCWQLFWTTPGGWYNSNAQ